MLNLWLWERGEVNRLHIIVIVCFVIHLCVVMCSTGGGGGGGGRKVVL